MNNSLRHKRYQSLSAGKNLDGKNCVSGPTAASYREDRRNSLQNSDAFPRFLRFFFNYDEICEDYQISKGNESSNHRGSCSCKQQLLYLVLKPLWLVLRPLLLAVGPLWPALRPSVWAVDCSSIPLNPLWLLQLILRPLWLTLRPLWLSLRLLGQTRKPLWQTLRPVWHLRIAQISWASDETTLDTVGWLSYSSNWPYDSSSWLSDPSG